MIKRARSYLEAGNAEQGVKLLSDVPKLFPNSAVRFKARLELGRYFFEQKQYDEALDEFTALGQAEDAKVRAEGIYRTGICHYEMNDFDTAFVSLRKVTTDYPWSVWANEAYYYIGRCHFKMKRWTRAYEALKMVGVSVPTNVEQTIGEAGRRLWVKVGDRDLVTLAQANGGALKVQLTTKGGDKEMLALAVNSQDGTEFLGSIPTAPGVAAVDDAIIQFLGNETVEVTYVDETTGSGETGKKLITKLTLASTASIGFTDGVYKDYVSGVRGNQPIFVRLKDFDASPTAEKETVEVVIRTEYKVELQDKDLIGLDISEFEDRYEQRDEVKLTLTESDAHSGMFVGQIKPVLLRGAEDGSNAEDVKLGDKLLHSRVGDRVVAEYIDENHPGVDQGPRHITARTTILDESQKDVEITQWVVNDVELKGRKHLIESQIYLRLAQVFKDVGLQEKADEKAEEGLAKVEEVIKIAVDSNLPQGTIEEVFNTKWDLLLVQNKLREAVGVCNALLRLYPDSQIADRALLQIGKAKLATNYVEEWQDSVKVFSAVLGLQKSELKAEAQFRIAQAQEKIGMERQKNADEKTIPQAAIVAYQTGEGRAVLHRDRRLSARCGSHGDGFPGLR
jgi:TolA-binding protein